MNVIDDCKQKTSFIKNFPPIRYFLEKGRVEKKPKGLFFKKSEFAELIESFEGDLSKRLLKDEIEKLKKLFITTPVYKKK